MPFWGVVLVGKGHEAYLQFSLEPWYPQCETRQAALYQGLSKYQDQFPITLDIPWMWRKHTTYIYIMCYIWLYMYISKSSHWIPIMSPLHFHSVQFYPQYIDTWWGYDSGISKIMGIYSHVFFSSSTILIIYIYTYRCAVSISTYLDNT
jgi:hypothetical protein